jgi:hypothetical protein
LLVVLGRGAGGDDVLERGAAEGVEPRDGEVEDPSGADVGGLAYIMSPTLKS